MNIYIYIYIYTHTHTHTHTYIYIYIYTYTYTCIHAYNTNQSIFSVKLVERLDKIIKLVQT